MNLLIRSATLVDPSSIHNGNVCDVSIVNGQITAIESTIKPDADTKVIEAKGQYLAPGFMDLNCNFTDPGFETKEDIDSGILAAAAGGFTGVALMPNTQPAIHAKTEVQYVMNRSRGKLVDVYPIGTISHGREGKDMAELYDMHQSGAVAFSDGNKPVSDAGLMSRAMLYAKGFDALVMSYPEDVTIAGKAKVNEGEVSTYLGMKGIPALAEELLISRDIYLAEYNDAPVHFSTISTSRAVEMIKQAKKKGLKVSCDVAAHHLVLNEQVLTGFDSNYKVKPPLRTKTDVKALLAGLKDGTIDAVVSQHTPHEIEFKDVEFEIAAYGIIALQTVLPLLLKAGIGVNLLVDKLAVAPRALLGLAVPSISVGSKANVVLFDTEEDWTLDGKTNRSRSANSPFWGQKLKGKVKLVCNNNKVSYVA